MIHDIFLMFITLVVGSIGLLFLRESERVISSEKKNKYDEGSNE